VFSGRAFAFSDCTGADCATHAAEIVSAEGISCGVLRAVDERQSAIAFFVTRSGSLVDATPLPRGDPQQPFRLRIRWWPDVLRD
jgi:hypothetical protein